MVRTAVNLGPPVAFWPLCALFPWCAYVWRSGLNYEWGYFWEEVCVFDCVCDDGELDGYGVVMGLFEGLFREERITENDESIWSRELFDSFLMPLCVFVCVDVYKAFEHLKNCVYHTDHPSITLHTWTSCALTRSWRGHMHSLMSYRHSGLWLEINVFVRATFSGCVFM